MEKVIVFGGSGNTGRYFTRCFLENNTDSEYRIITVGTRKTECFEGLRVGYYQVDIT